MPHRLALFALEPSSPCFLSFSSCSPSMGWQDFGEGGCRGLLCRQKLNKTCPTSYVEISLVPFLSLKVPRRSPLRSCAQSVSQARQNDAFLSPDGATPGSGVSRGAGCFPQSPYFGGGAHIWKSNETRSVMRNTSQLLSLQLGCGFASSAGDIPW